MESTRILDICIRKPTCGILVSVARMLVNKNVQNLSGAIFLKVKTTKLKCSKIKCFTIYFYFTVNKLHWKRALFAQISTFSCVGLLSVRLISEFNVFECTQSQSGIMQFGKMAQISVELFVPLVVTVVLSSILISCGREWKYYCVDSKSYL